jgi:hypothetical protein
MNIISYLHDLFDIDLQKICSFYNIDYHIYYQNFDNSILKTNFNDSKDIMIKKITNYIQNGIITKPSIIKYFNVYFGTNCPQSINDKVLYKQLNIYDIKIYHFLKSIGIVPSTILYNIVLNYWINDKTITYLQLLNEYINSNHIYSYELADKQNLLNKRYVAAYKVFSIVSTEYFLILSNKVK